MNHKLTQFAKKLKGGKLDGFIVTNPTNIFYLCGFKSVAPQEREATLIFSDSRITLITARLYQNEARNLKSLPAGRQVKIVDQRNKILEQVKKLLKNASRVGFEEEDLKYSEFIELGKCLTKSDLVPSKNIIEDLRIIKTEEEIKRIEKAQVISQKAFEILVKTIKVGQTEEEIAQKLAKIIKSLGGYGLAFETIVACGLNSSRPHYVTGNKKVTKGQVLLLDFGAKYQDYCADLSRTIFIGNATDPYKNIFYHVQKAQSKAVDKIAAGLKMSEVYHTTSRVFKAQKLNKYFIHGLGHGVGLEIHERPYLRPKVDDILQENMVFSVEPALYLPWGGVRIEDLILVENGRAKILGKLTDKIIEI